jgi:hypothetical protein
LGQTDGAAELARLSQDHPALRAPSLKALASMDDAACTDRLSELMANPDPMLRYGAFCSLRLADEHSTAAGGQMVNKAYWLHSVAPGSPGMVHLTSNKRCEIVLFGDNIKLRGPFTLPIGSDYTITVPANGDDATITQIKIVKNEPVKNEAKCPTDLYAALLTLGKLGGGYTEAVELIRRADKAQVLTSSVIVDAIVPELNIRHLAEYAAKDPSLALADREVARAGVVRPGIDSDGFDLPPPETDPATVIAPAPLRQPLNRSPGHLFSNIVQTGGQ